MIIELSLGFLVVVGVYFLLKKKTTFSSAETGIVAKLLAEETKAKADFEAGKEDVIAEYERLKARAHSLFTLSQKLPAIKAVAAPATVTAAPVAVATVVTPVATPVSAPVAPAPAEQAQTIVAVIPPAV